MNLNRISLRQISAARGSTFGIVACGRPASGVNAAISSAVTTIYQSGHNAVGFVDGMNGIMNGDAIALPPHLVSGIEEKGGVAIGTSGLNLQNKAGSMKEKLEKYGISGLIAICGTETGTAMAKLAETGFPVITVPKSMYNNVPGTGMSIGFWTAVNAAATHLRAIKENARSVNGTSLYIAEFEGLYSSALTLFAGNSAGATAVFIPEEYTLEGIRQIVSHSFPNRERLLARIAQTLTVRGEILNTANFLRMIEDDKIAEDDLIMDLPSVAATIAKIMSARKGLRISYGLFPVSQGIARKFMFDPYTFRKDDRKPDSFQTLGLDRSYFVKADKYGKPRFADIDTGTSLLNLTRDAMNGLNMPARVSLVSLNAGLDAMPADGNDNFLGHKLGGKAAELLISGHSGEMVGTESGSVESPVSVIAHSSMPTDYRGFFLPKPVALDSDAYEQFIAKQIWKSNPAVDVSPCLAE